MNNKLAALFLFAALLSGCAKDPVNVNDALPVPLLEAEFAPSPQTVKSQVRGQGRKVLITPVAYETKDEAQFATQAYDDLKRRVMKSGNRVIELKSAEKFYDEYSSTGKLSAENQTISDFVIIPKITNLSHSTSFTKAESWRDSKGKYHRRDAYCTFYSRATIQVNTFKLPDMTLVSSYNYHGTENESYDMNNSSCPIPTNLRNTLYKEVIRLTVRSGAYKTINDLLPDAYVVERRDNPKNYAYSIFRVSIGSLHGAVPDTEVKFYRKEERVVPITGEKKMERILLGSGIVIEPVDKSGSYVFVDDDELINSLKMVDVAKLYYNECDTGSSKLLNSCSTLWHFLSK